MKQRIKLSSIVLGALMFSTWACSVQKEIALTPQNHNINLWKSSSYEWKPVANAWLDRIGDTIATTSGVGMLYFKNIPHHKSMLFSTFEHSDCDLHLEVLLPPNGESGIYLQGKYKININDSYDDIVATTMHTLGSVGGSAKAEDNFQGIIPMANMANPAGAWNTIDVQFQAPKFNWSNKKVSNAIFLSVKVNGVEVHKNVEIPAISTGSELNQETISGPLMLENAATGVVFRNIIMKYNL